MKYILPLLLMIASSFGANVDYRSLGTNSFFINVTNSALPNGGGIDSKHWTNTIFGSQLVMRPVDESRQVEASFVTTNYFGLQMSMFRTNNPNGYSIGGYMLNKATNSAFGSPFYGLSKYGFIGESSDANSTLSAGDALGLFGVADGTFDSQYGVVGLGWGLKGSQTNVGVFGIATSAGQLSNVRNAGYFYNTLDTFASPQNIHPLFINGVIVGDSTTTGDPLLVLMTNSANVLVQINAAGDPVILNSAGARKIFVCQDGTGLGKWESVGPAGFGIGPGTIGFMSKFIASTNVTDSMVYNLNTNWIWSGMLTNLGAYTNSFTNFFVGEYTSANNWEALMIRSAPGHGSSSHMITPMHGSSSTEGDWPLVLANTWNFETTTPISGHAAGFFYPSVSDTYNIGSASSSVHQMTIGTSYLAFGATASGSQPSIQGPAGGINLRSGEVSFFRANGSGNATTAITTEAGQLCWDFAGNVLGGGTGMTNITAWMMLGPDQILGQLSLQGVIQIGTNNPSAATPLAVGFIGGPGTGTDKGGTDLKIIGGPSSGTGKPGDVRIQTSEPAASTSSSINSSIKDRMIVAARPVTLTESSATLVFNVALASGKFCGIRLMATTDADDATDFQAVSEELMISAVNKGGTVTATVAAGTKSTTQSSGTLTTTWTAVANGNSVDVKCNAVSSLTQTTLKTRYRVDLDGDGTLVTTLQ